MARARHTSLRTEIMVSTALLVGAALLFITMLLIRLGENDRLAEQVNVYLGQSRTLAHAFTPLDSEEQERLLRSLTAEDNIRTGLLVDATLEPRAGSWPVAETGQAQLRRFLRRALLQGEPVLELRHPASWLEPSATEGAGLQVALGFQGVTGKQVLYLHFPLEHVRTRTLEQLRLALWICLGYGLVLIGASVHILRRAVITPIEALTSVTEALMHGRTDARVDPAGPREIATLGESFNQMATTLEQNQVEQQRQVEELQDKNRELSATRLSLMQAARMASVGHLASGMAHEIGNPLSAVLAYLDLARGKDDPEVRDDLLQRAEAEAGRIDHIIRDMLDYAATDSGAEEGKTAQRCPVSDPLQVIYETVEMLRHQGVFKERQLQLELPFKLPECCIPPNHLQQILVNLLLNARDATSADGNIELRAGAQCEAVEIAVEDNGSGMSHEQQQAAFDPFFSGGKRGGRGLGLFVCYQQLKECGGDIMLKSLPHQGSCFTVLLRRNITKGKHSA
ncbi:MAG: HAMP domain-containing sensor histidine kinase [Desulfuromonadaceae bacterium]